MATVASSSRASTPPPSLPITAQPPSTRWDTCASCSRSRTSTTPSPGSASSVRRWSMKSSITKTSTGSATSGDPKGFSSGSPNSSGSRPPERIPWSVRSEALASRDALVAPGPSDAPRRTSRRYAGRDLALSARARTDGGRCRQQIRHPLVVRRVARPPFCGGVVPMVLHRQVDTVIDEESRSVLVPIDGGLVENARRLVRTPVRIDVGAALEKERRDLEVPIQHCPGERDVQDHLRGHRPPTQVGTLWIVGRVVVRQGSQDGLAVG